MDETENMQSGRKAVRERMGRSSLYTDSVAGLYAWLRAFVPDLNVEQSAAGLVSIGLFLMSAPECEGTCVHHSGYNIAALGDRMLIDCEMERQYNA